ncbi:MAG: thioesterase family protein [Myxococcaceae bacterium]
MSGGWPLKIEIKVAWGEMDAFQHVNNTVYLRWFESARIAFFEKVGMNTIAGQSGAGPILARATVDFLKPVTYPDTITVEARVESVGNTSFVMHYRASSARLGECARGEGVVVMFDYASGSKVKVSDQLRARLTEA